MRRLVLPGALLVACAAAAAALAGPAARGDRPEPVTLGFNQGDLRQVPVLAGISPITGKRVSTASWRGRPLVINAWGSWCNPCVREAPELRTFSRKHPGVLLGLDVADPPPGARAFYRRFRLTYPSIGDPNTVLFTKLKGKGTPTTVFLDARHRVVAEFLGAVSAQALERGLRLARASR